MPAGRPDFTQLVLVQGIYGTTLHTIAVDASGRIIMVPYGATEVTGAVDVTQTDSVREIQGKDGLTLRTVVVDASGQIIMVPRGQSGNYMNVDASGFLTSVMKGVDGVTLRTVAVDASGNIVGVLQGDYAGSLKTLAVDSQGRMLAVLSDPEDVFGNPHYMGAAELAVRLGSIDSYERRGNVIWMDGFESGLAKWYTNPVGTGAAIALDAAHARSGCYSVRLTAGSDGYRRAEIGHALPYPVLSRLGFEFSWMVPQAIDQWVQRFYVYDGVNVTLFGIRWDDVNTRLQYQDSAAAWVTFATAVDTFAVETLFNTAKLVADGVNKRYMRLILNGQTYDLSGIDAYVEANATLSHLWSYLYVVGRAGNNDIMCVDDVIITQNEA